MLILLKKSEQNAWRKCGKFSSNLKKEKTYKKLKKKKGNICKNDFLIFFFITSRVTRGGYLEPPIYIYYIYIHMPQVVSAVRVF